MHYTRLTPAQIAEIASGNRAMLAQPRAPCRSPERLLAERANAANFGQSQIDQAKNLLDRAHSKQLDRRFTGASVTGFGGLL